MHADASDSVEEAPAVPLLLEPAVITRPPLERGVDWQRTGGLIAAGGMHALILLLILLAASVKQQPAEPDAIPVEVVNMPPEPTKAAPPAQPGPPPQPQPYRQSGGELNRSSGSTPDTDAPKTAEPSPQPPAEEKAAEAQTPTLPPPPEPPAPATDLTAPATQPETKSSAPLSKPQQQKPPKSARAPAKTAALAPNRQPSAAKAEDDWVGGGGGDKYLNALRDDILRNRSYPPEIRSIGLDGTAQYEIVLDRQGGLLHLRLLRSSGIDVLDHAGLVMIEKTAPFQPLPPDIEGDAVQLVVTLHMAP
jgi:periplasmic protein TonB